MNRKWVHACTLGLALAAGMKDVEAQALEDFGYDRLEALGGRPLLVILTDFEGSPALRSGSAQEARDYFDNLAFNPYGSPSDPSLKTYYEEISNGRFYWSRAGAGVMGPYHFTPAQYGTDNGGLSRLTLALKAAADDGLNFAQFDQDGDGTVDNHELGVVVIDNYSLDGVELSTYGSNRRSDPNCFKPDGQEIKLCLRGAMAGHYASFLTIAHELLHSLGAEDLYGATQRLNEFFTTMSSTPATGPRAWHLDPFHKMQLGWVEPRVFSINTPRSAAIGAAHLIHDDQPLILYSPYDLHEYFMLEYRTNPSAGSYDDVPTSGLVIWHVRVNDDRAPVAIPSLTVPGMQDLAVFMLGAPDMTRGKARAWAPAPPSIFGPNAYVIPSTLRWLSGVDSGVQVQVGETVEDGAKLQVAWGNFPEKPRPENRKIVYFNNLWAIGDVGELDDQGNPTILDAFSVDYTGYTHVVDDPAGLFYYNTNTGRALLASVDAAGNHTVTKVFPQGSFGPGWTHVVSHRGYLFFYSAGNGMAAIGKLSSSGFRQLQSYPAGSFGTGWTHIVSTLNGIVYYASGNGMGAIGDWDFEYAPCNGFCFPTIAEVRHKTLSWFPAGSFATGWSSIVDTRDGVLFYRKSDGLQVMVDVLGGGAVVTRGHSFRQLKTGYTAVVNLGATVLFYDAATGDGAVAQVLAADPWVYSGSVGTLRVLAEWSGYFSPGWTHLVTTADPQLVH